MTGYWRLPGDKTYEPPQKLAAFLADGPPPIFVGFGSMTSRDPKTLGRIVVQALRRANQRGIVSTGWAELEIEENDEIISIPAVPYHWLFPRMAAVRPPRGRRHHRRGLFRRRAKCHLPLLRGSTILGRALGRPARRRQAGPAQKAHPGSACAIHHGGSARPTPSQQRPGTCGQTPRRGRRGNDDRKDRTIIQGQLTRRTNAPA